jgi:Protein of unknown function (DUF2946)
MKQRTIRQWIALVALGAHAFVPFAAYASVKAGASFGDVCSVFGKAQASTSVLPGLPLPGSKHPATDHCALCPGGSAAAALVPPPLPIAQMHTRAVVADALHRDAPASLLLLLPPSRGPPATA